MRYILNSAVITAPGDYAYKYITPTDAITWLHERKWESTIGYKETAEALQIISKIKIPVNRKVITMKEGDEALVFRLVFPQGYRPEPNKKGNISIEFILKNCEIGLLRRIK